ncbi:MAG: complex I NDUFA9 subunit family protein [Proteobacteria bacterium]|nr:complex I NDUFA9 subunit family protein [Pseudomonadota bacterium]
MNVIAIFGGSGFIGSELIYALAKHKVEIRLFTQNKFRANHLKVFPSLKLVQYNSKSNLLELLKGTDTVINCIGILHENHTNQFNEIHAIWLKKLAGLIKQLKIKRFIHLSALRAEKNAPSKYLKSKFRGEKYIQEICKASNWTIFRPSVVFGENDSFINLFSKMIQFLPIIFVVSSKAKFQPIAVNDLISIIVKSIDDKKTFKKIYNVGGPKIYTFMSLLKLISNSMHKQRLFIPLSRNLSYAMVRLLEFSPVKLITRDNLKSMELDNVTAINDAYQFESALIELETYLDKLHD